MKALLLILSLLFLYPTSLIADDHTIGVLDFSGEGIHEEELKSLSAQFRKELLKMDTLRVLDYDDMLATLSQAGYERPTCTTLSCGVIVSMLLEQDWMVNANISKIGEVFIVEAYLFDAETGRVVNFVTYDNEISLTGLISRGMHNVAELLLSTRVPLEVHQRQNLVYIKTKPAGALVRVGNDTLTGKTPMALDRVFIESRPILILKDGFEPYKVDQLPEDYSDVLYYELQHRVPQIGQLVFANPIPKGIVIVSEDGKDRFLIEENAVAFADLPAGDYTLQSSKHIINKGNFRVRHRRTTQIDPEIFLISDIKRNIESYKKRRNITIGLMATSIGYRTYLTLQSDNLYKKYSNELQEGDSRHQLIKSMDNQKPIFDILSISLTFSSFYYHLKYTELKKSLIK